MFRIKNKRKIAFALAEAAKPHLLFKDIRKPAFTLAEVLITLGIIGIVAAMTIPMLVGKYQKKVTGERVKKAYSEVLNVIKRSEADNDEMRNWDFNLAPGNPLENTKLVMDKYYLPYFKNLNYCDSGCTNVIGKCGVCVSSVGHNYIFNNGVGLSVRLDSDSKGYIIIDINGPQKPNVIGKDAFYFGINNYKFLPVQWDDKYTRQDLIDGVSTVAGTMACRPSRDTDTEDEKTWQYNLYMCTALLMMDGWEIKDDYPW